MEKVYHVLCLALVILLVGCTSPEEKALEYLEKGQARLEAGEPVKAKLEFHNALELDEKLTAAWYGLALVAEQQGELREAFSLLNRVIELEPKHLEALVKKGYLLLIDGNLDEVLEISNTTLELAPEDTSVLALRASVFYGLEDTEGAIRLANQVLVVDPANTNALVVLADERLAAGDSEKALEYLEQGINADEKNVVLQSIKIATLSRLGELDTAEQVFLRLIELYPQTTAFRHQLAGLYMEQFREQDAEQIYRDIAVADPEDMNARLDVVRFVNDVRGFDAAMTELRQFIEAEPDNMQLVFALGQLQQAAGQREAARKTLQTIVSQAESGEDVNRAKGQLAVHLMQDGQQKQAMALVGEILAQDSRNEQALLLKSSQLIEQRKLDQAISDLRTILRDTPDSARALLLLGQAHELAGAKDLADDRYADAFEASGQSPEFGLPYANFLLKSQRGEQAAGILQDGLSRRADHLPSLTLLAQLRLDNGDWAGAQAIADHVEQLQGAEGVSQQIMGAMYAGQQNPDQSIAAFRQAYQASAFAAEPMESLVRAYVRAGKSDEAHSFLDAALAANPDNNSARLLKARLYLGQQAWDNAARLLGELIESEPTNITAYRVLAELEVRTGKPTAALKVLDKGLAANPGSSDLNLFKAQLLEREGDFDGAIATYEELLVERPNADVVANNLANLLSEHRTDEASLRQANELAKRFRSSDVPHFKDTLGWTYYRLGDAEEASELIEDAVKSMPEYPMFHYHLGMCYLAMDDKAAARQELEEALKLAGENAPQFREKVEDAIKSL